MYLCAKKRVTDLGQMSWASRVGCKGRDQTEQKTEQQTSSLDTNTDSTTHSFESLRIHSKKNTYYPAVMDWSSAFSTCLSDLSTYTNLRTSDAAKSRFETYHRPRLEYLLPEAADEFSSMDEDEQAETTRYNVGPIVWGLDLFMAVDWYRTL